MTSFRLAALAFVILLLFVALGWSVLRHNEFVLTPEVGNPLTVPEAKPPIVPPPAPPISHADIEPQETLKNPPSVIKAIYATNWSVSSEKRLTYFINLIKETELNALVIDIKDYSGYVGYNTKLELPEKYNAVELRIPRLNALIKRLHNEGIYVIGRVAVFQDPRLALARPDLALHSSSTQQIWRDRKGLSWLDTASPEVWDYNIAIAKELVARGMDEVNFDYIRFPSDGNLNDIVYPAWNGKTLKTKVVRDFFSHVREEMPDATLSADLFGLATVDTQGMGIGQQLEYALPYFNATAPMVYPSHYASGFIGYKNPADHPYEIVKYSLDNAVRRIAHFASASTTPQASHPFLLRPWLQDFNLGAVYGPDKVRAQIQAVYDALCARKIVNDPASTSSPVAPVVPCKEEETNAAYYNGWMLWNPSNVYTKGALLP